MNLFLPGGAKTVCVALVLVALVGTAGLVGAQVEVEDVPQEHPYYNAILELVNKGYLQLYEGGEFRGAEKVDRYTLAAVVARLLERIEQGAVGVTPDDVQLLRRITNEFREELTEYYKSRAQSDELLKRYATEYQDIHGKLAFVGEALDKVAEVLVSLQEDMQQVEVLSSRLGQAEEETDSLGASLAAVDSEVVQLEQDLLNLKGSLEKTRQSLDSELQSLRSDSAQERRALATRLSQTEQQVAEMLQDIKKAAQERTILARDMEAADQQLGNQLTQTGETLAALALRIGELEQAVEGTKSELTQTIAQEVGNVESSSEAKLKQLGEQFQSMQEELAAVRQELRSQAEEMQATELALRKFVEGVQAEIIDIHLPALTEELRAEFSSELRRMEGDLQEVQARVDDTKSMLQQTDAQISEFASRLDAAGAHVTALEEALGTKADHALLQQLKAELAALRETSGELQARQEQLAQAVSGNTVRLDEFDSSLQALEVSLSESVALLQKQNAELAARVAEVDSSLDTARAELKSELQQTEDRLRTEYGPVKNKLTELDNYLRGSSYKGAVDLARLDQEMEEFRAETKKQIEESQSQRRLWDTILGVAVTVLALHAANVF